MGRASERVRLLRTVLANPRRLRTAARLVIIEDGSSIWRAGLATDLPPSERRSLACALLAGEGCTMTFTAANGTHWTARNERDGICESLLTNGSYQGENVNAMLAWIAEHRPDRQTVVDVGANIGTTTVPFAQAGFDVIAVEPVPATFALLERNVIDNGLIEHVRLANAAVSADPTVTMRLAAGSLGASEIATPTAGFEVYGYTDGGTVDVRGLRLDHVVSEPSDIAVVWCDVQGGEADVIETGESLWSAGVPLYTEFWPHSLRLHGGLDRFLDAARRWFAVAEIDGKPMPVEELVVVADGMGDRDYCDVLLHAGSRKQ